MRIVDFKSAVAFLESVKSPFEAPNEGSGKIVIVEVCGRCGGSGRYSWNQMDKDRCFGCTAKGAPSSWKVSVDAVEHARGVKAKIAKQAREAKRAEEIRAREEDYERLCREVLPGVVDELERFWLPQLDENGRYPHWGDFSASVASSLKAVGLDVSAKLEVLDEHGNVERYQSVVDELHGRFKKAARAKKGEGRRHVGKVGEKVDLEVRLVRSSSYERRSFRPYGGMETGWVHVFSDDAGNVLVWFSSKALGDWDVDHWDSPAPGERLRLVASVKEHGKDRDGLPQSVVQRAKVSRLPKQEEQKSA